MAAPSSRSRPGRIYTAYGMRVSSRWTLPCDGELTSTLADIELEEAPATVFSAAVQEANSLSGGNGWFRHVRLADGSDYLRWTGLFEFLVSPDGQRILGRPLERATEEAFQAYLLGQVLSFALVKRGVEPLHATAVVVNGATVGFLGQSGYGKSTLGAAFLQAGFPLLTDDLLVTDEWQGAHLAHPGLRRIKLFPAIAGRLLGNVTGGTPMNPDTDKLVIPLPAGPNAFAAEPAPLKALYVLAAPPATTQGAALTILRLPPRRAFLALTRNTFNTIVAEPSRLERQFTLASRLATTIAVKQLAFPRSAERLAEVRDAILEDLAA